MTTKAKKTPLIRLFKQETARTAHNARAFASRKRSNPCASNSQKHKPMQSDIVGYATTMQLSSENLGLSLDMLLETVEILMMKCVRFLEKNWIPLLMQQRGKRNDH